jgi:polysaccharide deacetylase family protein (PEP-CTERM system associated)
MTCDVEDYFQVSAFDGVVSRKDWKSFDCRIASNVDRILQHFDNAGIKGTFFILGWVAQHHPQVIRRIASEGHEIASHGLEHRRVWQQSATTFREDVLTTRILLEDIAGIPVIGYRAASWSIDSRTHWAYEVLGEAGYRYSSSIYPISHDHYGAPEAPTRPHEVAGTGVLEIPASVIRLAGRNFPVSGGGYFRLYPLSLSIWMIERRLAAEPIPYVFYFHPWEIDPEQPRIPDISLKTRIRHYLNLNKFEDRLCSLLDRFRWGRMDEIFLTGPRQ